MGIRMLGMGCMAVLTALAASGEEAGVTTLYVAVNGNNSWSGTLDAPNDAGTDGPLASLVGARVALRGLRAADTIAGPVRVLVRGGVYFQPEPLTLGPEDSGSAEAPVTFAAYPGETPVISGGTPITNWVQDGNLWVADLPEVVAGGWYFSALWVNGERRQPARSPNEGFFLTAAKAPPIPGETVDRNRIAFVYTPGDIARWDNLDDAIIFSIHSWDTSQNRIASLDEENHIVTFKEPVGWPFMNWEEHQRYCVLNVFEALDRPGEWYLNRKTGKLYYYPLEGEAIGQVEAIAPVAGQSVLIEGVPAEDKFVDCVSFDGLTFAYTDYTVSPAGRGGGQAATIVPAAIQATGARHCAVENCVIEHIGTYGIWFRAGSKDCRAVRNHLRDMGAGGIRIGESGDPATENEAAERNVVDNNWIHDGGRIFPEAVGVQVARSSYNTVSHNEISDLFYTGISVGWCWGYAEPSSAHHNIIEYNHIHHLGFKLLSDMGGIYTLGIADGTVLRYNHIHDVQSFMYGGWGIYPDEGSTHLLIENNVVYNTKTGGFHQHYGRENLVRNNIFAFAHQGQLIRTRDEEHISFTLEHNIVYFNNGQLLGSSWKNGNYKLDYNCYWDTSGVDLNFAGSTFDEWKAKGYDAHSINENPLFVNAEAFDFRLKPDSPALDIGFKPIDISTAGLYGDAEWVDAPKAIAREPWPLPTPPEPYKMSDGFEETNMGETAANAQTSGETDAARIRVTDEIAASGKHCLKCIDAPGLDQPWNPHFYYQPGLNKGTIRGSFDIRLEPGAIVTHEWRDQHSPYRVGPSLIFDGANKQLQANGKTVLELPADTWLHIEITCPLKEGKYTLTVTTQGQEPKTIPDIATDNPEFRALDWCGFISNAQTSVAWYLDNVKIEEQ